MTITFLNAQGWPEVSGTTPEAHALSAATPTPTTIPARAFVVIGYAHQDGATAITALSDSNGAGDTWSVSSGNYLETSGDGTVGIAFGQIGPTALSSSSGSITATYSSNAYQYRQMSALAFSGVVASSPQDGTAKTMAATYTNVATLDSALSYSAGDLVVGVFYQYQTDNQVLTPVAGLSVFSTVESSRRCDIVYGVMSSAGSITKFGTYAAYVSPMGIAVAFKAASSGGSVTGAATLSASGSLAATGSVTAAPVITGAASLSAAGTMAAAGSVVGAGPAVQGAASLSATATLAASAAVAQTVTGACGLTAVGSMSGTGGVARTGDVALSTVGTLDATGAVNRTASASITAHGSLAAAASVRRAGASANLSATATLTVSAAVSHTGHATLQADAALLAATSVSRTGSAALSATGTLTATARGSGTAPAIWLPTDVTLDPVAATATLQGKTLTALMRPHQTSMSLLTGGTMRLRPHTRAAALKPGSEKLALDPNTTEVILNG